MQRSFNNVKYGFCLKGALSFGVYFFFISLDKILDFSLSFSSSPALGFAIF